MSALAKSMTGYARVRRSSQSGGEISLSVKSVNHRGLDIHLHTSLDLAVENEIRSLIKKRITRGHVEVRIGFTKSNASAEASAAQASLNRPLFEAYLGALREASELAGVNAQPDLGAALRIPGMITGANDRELTAEDEQMVLEALDEALTALNGFREREGGELVSAMLAHNARVRENRNKIAELRAKATELYRARLEEKLAELLRGVSIEPQRLAQEAAILADRSDVSEEVTRLGVHAAELDGMLERGGELGKKVDFLLQEMNRETNTILSKTNGIGGVGLEITSLGIGIKSEIEKIREQALNLE